MLARGDSLQTVSSAGSNPGIGATSVTRLTVLHGPGAGLMMPLERGQSLIVGRQTGLPFTIADAEMSKQHLRIDLTPAGAVVTDLGSRNGTFLEGARCHRAPLVHGNVLRAGASLLLWEDELLPSFIGRVPPTGQVPGPSVAMQRVRGEIALVAPQTVPVMILGATGTGKELVAKELHRQSQRTGAFVPVNCAAISPALAESEFFGHAPGAFTGAHKKSDGLFVAAEQGTLFLDEVGELSSELQAKLLRALAVGEVRPVGSSQVTHADVRVVCATHRDLPREIEGGRFREDLFARLSGWQIRIPPLRARRADVLALAEVFLHRLPAFAAFSADVAEALVLYQWPFNVRELEQVVTASVIRAQGSGLRSEHLPETLKALLLNRSPRGVSAAAPMVSGAAAAVTPSREELCRLLDSNGGNVAKVAEHFAKDRRQIYRWAERFGVDPDSFRRE